MKKQYVNTDAAPKAIGPYSQGVKGNGFLFVSGQLPVHPRDRRDTGKCRGPDTTVSEKRQSRS